MKRFVCFVCLTLVFTLLSSSTSYGKGKLNSTEKDKSENGKDGEKPSSTVWLKPGDYFQIEYAYIAGSGIDKEKSLATLATKKWPETNKSCGIFAGEFYALRKKPAVMDEEFTANIPLPEGLIHWIIECCNTNHTGKEKLEREIGGDIIKKSTSQVTETTERAGQTLQHYTGILEGEYGTKYGIALQQRKFTVEWKAEKDMADSKIPSFEFSMTIENAGQAQEGAKLPKLAGAGNTEFVASVKFISCKGKGSANRYANDDDCRNNLIQTAAKNACASILKKAAKTGAISTSGAGMATSTSCQDTALALSALLRHGYKANDETIVKGMDYLCANAIGLAGQQALQPAAVNAMCAHVLHCCELYNKALENAPKDFKAADHKKMAAACLKNLLDSNPTGEKGWGGPDTANMNLALSGLLSARRIGIFDLGEEKNLVLMLNTMKILLSGQEAGGDKVELLHPFDPSGKGKMGKIEVRNKTCAYKLKAIKEGGIAMPQASKSLEFCAPLNGTTAMALCHLLLTTDSKMKRKLANEHVDKMEEFINNGLGWIQENYKPYLDEEMENENPYYMYSLCRLGEVTNVQFFGDRKWRRDISLHLCFSQKTDGTWTTSKSSASTQFMNTIYCLLFLDPGPAGITSGGK